MKYKTILLDPPWKVSGGKNGKFGFSKSVSPDYHYPLMSTKEIMNLPVSELVEPDAHMYLWVVNGLLQDGLDCMRHWGFRYVNNIVWHKTSGYGIGQYFRGDHEICLFGIKGRPGYKRDSEGKKCQARSVISAPRTRHSEKPSEVHRLIEHVSPGPYLEMFARKPVDGWTVWGNEVTSLLVLPEVNLT